MFVELPFGGRTQTITLPDGCAVLRMKEPAVIRDPAAAIGAALENPVGCLSLRRLAAAKAGPLARACIVVSDKTRPVPYKGGNGLLLPILKTLIAAGFVPERTTVLVGTGMHGGMPEEELVAMLGPEPFALGVKIVNHDCRDSGMLLRIGATARGTEAFVNRRYIEADLKILTGLVESHFMAGASGGRKSVCPGIFGEEGTRVFHGAALMSHPEARDLVLEGNPVHEESLAVARMAGADFIANVTLDSSFRMTGVFCGELEAAHSAAVARLRSYVGIPVNEPFDLAVTHGGFVAQNHYQAAKAAVASLGALKSARAGLILVADNRDPEPVGSDSYRSVLSLLKTVGPENLDRVLASPDWTFVVDQWEVQMWAKVFKRVGMDDFTYFAPQPGDGDWRVIPGVDGRMHLPAGIAQDDPRAVDAVVRGAVSRHLSSRGCTESDVASGRFRMAWLADGPYGIPLPTAR